MARFGDKGPYAAWNVKIITNFANGSEAKLGKPLSNDHAKKISSSKSRKKVYKFLETKFKHGYVLLPC